MQALHLVPMLLVLLFTSLAPASIPSHKCLPSDYQFQLAEYADAPDTSGTFIDWAYDAFGRKVAGIVYDNTNTVTSNTLYVYDGWRLVSELDGLKSNRVVAEYVPGPTYVDDTVAMRRDLSVPLDGDFNDAGEGFLYCAQFRCSASNWDGKRSAWC